MSELFETVTRADLIAFAACLVSVYAVIVSKRAWREDQKANRLVLLTKQQEIYDKFFDLKMHMQIAGSGAKMDEVSKFYYFKRIAAIYLPHNLAVELSNYFDACFEIADHNRKQHLLKCVRSKSVDNAIDLERELAKEIEEELFAILRKSSAYQAPVLTRIWRWLLKKV